VTPTVLNDTGALQQAGRNRHGRAAHPEHLPKKLLRQRDDVAFSTVVRLEQPAGKSRFEGIAGTSLSPALDFSHAAGRRVQRHSMTSSARCCRNHGTSSPNAWLF
jgi:hypothetical protein